jgi:hypothetical protein
VNEQKQIQNVENENDKDIDVNYETFTVDKSHQINKISYIILGLITNKNLFILIFYVHMNFLVRQTKSTTSIVIDLIMNTFNTTPIAFMNSKYHKF